MTIPSATYRVQLSPDFTFRDLEKIIPYISKLGVSTLYVSPVFKARPGSSHGYDVVQPLEINPELGGREGLEQVRETARQYGITWIQDIVPNHMAMDCTNPWLYDVWEKGPFSYWHGFFDIDWEHPDVGSGGIMVPLLGGTAEECFRDGVLRLHYDEQGFFIKYHEHEFPLNYLSYPELLSRLEDQLYRYHENLPDFYPLKNAFERVVRDPGSEMADWENLKARLFDYLAEHSLYQEYLLPVLEDINESYQEFEPFLNQQFYGLYYWKTTEQIINYRRFFTVNDLICLRQERDKVFDNYHGLIAELVQEGVFNGLRVDHVDGLFSPENYLNALRNLSGKNTYLIVEKILESNEALPFFWPVQGTTGYDFLADVNQLFTDSGNADQLNKIAEEETGEILSYEEELYRDKYKILKKRMAGELENLVRVFIYVEVICPEELQSINREDLKEAFAVLLASFPVYRTYIEGFPVNEQDQQTIEEAFSRARNRGPEYDNIYKLLRPIFAGSGGYDEEMDSRRLKFLKRFQQLSGPLAAKGGEDTAFYCFNRLISHNEVGDSPGQLGADLSRFHERMQQRLRGWPHALNATATHDTKRGEDARMRINVLSEIPEVWHKKVREWKAIAKPLKAPEGIPDSNDEYVLYQSITGHLPLDSDDIATFRDRIKQYTEKALRESKRHTSWSQVNPDYEEKVFEFIDRLLLDKEFNEAIKPFIRWLAHYGAIYSLGQLMIKLTAPGVPDIYQGTEYWDLNMVDPDNRRAVDYDQRHSTLDRFFKESDYKDLLEEFREAGGSGHLKQYLMHKTLCFRQEHAALFSEGDYVPLVFQGKQASSLVGYMRAHNNKQAIVIVPRLLANSLEAGELPVGLFWKDHYVQVPESGTGAWYNVLTGGKINKADALHIADILQEFPVALLTNQNI